MASHRSDEQVAKEALADRESFGVLMERYEARLLRYIRRLGVAQDDADDVLQESFLRMYKGLASFDPTLPFSSWAYRITHNQAVSWMRKHKRPERQTVPLDQENEDGLRLLDLLASDEDIAGDTERKEHAEAIRETIQQLPLKYREVLVLRHLEEYSYEEIGDILKKPKGTVATQIRRARQRLEKELRASGLHLIQP
ncbi:MAG: RNA polymerase sigma factor [Candidatus Doudnabacteria bacterium]|nr:RNA polymerase sigma factor [Candidatus Doudnabacteria bacterium]MCA9387758.1 RNA polymerase sigma factor [Candidatus Andersenbacteria bacterium]